MKLPAILGLLLAAAASAAAACTTNVEHVAPPGADADGGTSPGDGTDGGGTVPPTDDAGTHADAGHAGDAAPPAPPVPVGTSTMIVPTLYDYAVTDATLFYTSGSVMRAGLDGSAPTTVAGVTGGAIAVDGTNLYVANASGLVAMPLAGGAATTLASTLPGTTHAIAVAAGSVYFSWGEDDPPHGISRVAITATNATPQLVASMNPRSVRAVAAGTRVFALDYGDPVTLGNTRDGGLWALDGSGASHLTHQSFGAIFSGGSLAAYGTDVYVRQGQGLVKYPSTATAGTTPVTVVPKAACAIDGYDVSSTVAVDASGIYIACQVGTGDYEIRRYSSAGVLLKVLGKSPNSGYGFVSDLRVDSTYAYWKGRPADNWSLYRAAK